MCYRKIEARIAGVVWEAVLSLLPEELAKNMQGSIQETRPDGDAIEMAAARGESVPSAEGRRGSQLRVA